MESKVDCLFIKVRGNCKTGLLETLNFGLQIWDWEKKAHIAKVTKVLGAPSEFCEHVPSHPFCKNNFKGIFRRQMFVIPKVTIPSGVSSSVWGAGCFGSAMVKSACTEKLDKLGPKC